MPYHITCTCGRLTVVPDDIAGQTIRCSRCNAELKVPEFNAPRPPPVPALEPDNEPVIIIDTESSPLRGGSNDPSVKTVRLVAVAMALLALVGVLPVLLTSPRSLVDPPAHWLTGQVLEPWALTVIVVAILHLVYLIYLLQLPDYSCVRVVSLFLLLISVSYALVLGIRMLAPAENPIVQLLALESNRFSARQESLWCFMMMTLTGTLSYLAGHAASRWRARLMAT